MMQYLTSGKFADAMTFGGSCSAMTLWGLQLSDWGVIASAIVAVLGFVMNLVFKLRADHRALAEHQAVIEDLVRGNTRLRRSLKTSRKHTRRGGRQLRKGRAAT